MNLSISAVALTFVFALSCHAQATSVYTEMWSGPGCKVVEKDESGPGYIRFLCKGPAGFKYESIEGDIRQTLNVIEPSGKKTELALWSNISGYFSTAGPKIEWRIVKKAPVALIVRFSVDKNSDTPKDELSQLVVVRLKKDDVCITDVVKASKDQNLRARKSADASADAPCLFKN